MSEPKERNRKLVGSRLSMTDHFTYEYHVEDELVDFWQKQGSMIPREPTVEEVREWLRVRSPEGPADGLPVDPKSLGWGPAPSEEAPERVWLWRVSRDYDPASSMGRQRWSEDADAYPPEYLVGEYVRGRAAVGDQP